MGQPVLAIESQLGRASGRSRIQRQALLQQLAARGIRMTRKGGRWSASFKVPPGMRNHLFLSCEAFATNGCGPGAAPRTA